MVAPEIYFLILFERNYVSQTNTVFLDDKHEASDMKTDLPKAVNKFHKSSFTLIWLIFVCVCMTTTLTSSSCNKGNCLLSLCLYEIFLEVACQLQPEL